MARMTKKEKQARASSKERGARRKEIIAMFGVKAVGAAYIRLCANCAINNCFLTSLCTDGSDCPYFKQRKEEI